MSTEIADILALVDKYEKELPAPPPPLRAPVGAGIAAWIDHTMLRADTTTGQIKKLCEEAREHRFANVCVNPAYVPLAAGLLHGSFVGICAVVAFPLGADLPEYKAYETRSVITAGASEVDMVMNIGALKSAAYTMVLKDIQVVVEEAHPRKARVKVIIEAGLLSRREKILACLLSQAAGADFVKTSTDFGAGGAKVEDVALMRRVVGAQMGVKAAGGIRTLNNALEMIAAGANRIGASAGINILHEAVAQGAH
jgi:deoxyribose-phosphate aldolase